MNQHTGEVLDFRCRLTLKGLADPLKTLRDYSGAVKMKLRYEASYVGFSLQRGLNDRGYVGLNTKCWGARGRTKHGSREMFRLLVVYAP
ncbi:MAG: hypothetical protein PVI91_12670 [Gammaproteobacteria bacterium]